MPPIMANSNKGQYHKDKYFDASRKVLSPEITMCNMEALASFFFRSYDQCIFFSCSKVMIKLLSTYKKNLITRDTHVNYQSSSNPCSKVISKVKVFKKWDKLQGQGQRVKINGTQRKVVSQGILM